MTQADIENFLGLLFMTGIVTWIALYHLFELKKDVGNLSNISVS